jgi:hypothetical protein
MLIICFHSIKFSVFIFLLHFRSLHSHLWIWH